MKAGVRFRRVSDYIFHLNPYGKPISTSWWSMLQWNMTGYNFASAYILTSSYMFIPLSGINCVISNECIIACILIAENRSISVGSEKKGGGLLGEGCWHLYVVYLKWSESAIHALKIHHSVIIQCSRNSIFFLNTWMHLFSLLLSKHKWYVCTAKTLQKDSVYSS